MMVAVVAMEGPARTSVEYHISHQGMVCVLSILTYGRSLLSRIRVWPPYLVINFQKTQKEEVGPLDRVKRS